MMDIIKIHIKENKPFPNNEIPVIIYKDALETLFDDSNYSDEEVLRFLESNRYSNGWTNGILTRHHFHSNAHEVLACVSGSASVQLGGPKSDIITFKKGDVLFLPAGTAHKNIETTGNFTIVGAYPNGGSYDMRYGEIVEYEQMKVNIGNVDEPKFDPVTGNHFKYSRN